MREIIEDNLIIIADHYGLENQLRQLAEECSELTVEANHSARRGSVTNRLIEKMVDVEIMIDQVRYLADIKEYDVFETRYWKLKSRVKEIRQETSNEDMRELQALLPEEAGR